ncbi:MAG: NAD(P)-binding domain-containing protein [Candidatus Acidiferrum sp.]
MKIGIIGAGNVGGTLGLGWAKRGHEIVFACAILPIQT